MSFLKKNMQLFIHHHIHIQGDKLIIKEAWELVRQLRKVLRASAGYIFCVQNKETRREIQLENWTDKEVSAHILQKRDIPKTQNETAMAIALPNKQEKLELIIQKLTEIWIQTIYLRAAERSVIKQLSENKQERLHKIIQEALEQSRWRNLPEIRFITTLREITEKYQLCVFDLSEKGVATWKSADKPLLWIIGPEGGLTEKDYAQFGDDWQGIKLWTQVLRMETAAIIWAWLIHEGKISL